MSDPDATTMRERLELAAAFQDPACKRINNRPFSGPMHAAQVDAILRAMLEPSEGMKKQAYLTKYMDKGPVVVWRAMIQHIIDEAPND
jgi:hypothetical protein